MKNKITSLLVAALITSTLSMAQNFAVLYDFDSVKTNSGLTDPTPLPTATNVTFGAFTAVGTPTNPNATLRFSYTNWPTGATNTDDVYTSLTGAIDAAQYYEVTITPNSGFTIDLTSISFGVQRSGQGIRTYAVRSSADSYASNLTATIAPANANLSVEAGDVFFWNFDATTSNQNGSTITLSGSDYTNVLTPVTFRFYGWNSEGSIGTFSIDNVTINGSVNGAVIALYTANNVCEGDSIHFMDMSTSTLNIIDWAWDFGGGSPQDSAQNPVHYFSAPGMHVVALTVTDDSLNTDTYTDTVYVYPKPVAAWEASTSGLGICVGSEVDFSNLSAVSTGNIASSAWTFGDFGSGINNTSILQTPSHTYAAAGTYAVELIVTSDMGCKDTVTANTTVGSYPVAAFSFAFSGNGVNYTDESTGGVTSWYWDLGDLNSTSDISTAQNPSYSGYLADAPVTACLTVTTSVGCSDTVCEVIFTSGINENGPVMQVAVYPSPSNDGVFTMDVEASSIDAAITVYNVIGKTVHSGKLMNTKQMLDLSSLDNGSYFVAIKNETSVITRKIIISK